MTDWPLLAATEEGRWRPGIGDPSVIGWVTVVAYVVASLASVRAAQRDKANGLQPWFWVSMALLTAALGVNKQLDFQTLFTEIARDTFRAWGAYDRRRMYQVAFIVAVGLVCVGLVAVSFRFVRPDLRSRLPAAIGLVFLLGFVTVRASSFHHVDLFLAARVGGMKWNWILELSGIGLIAMGAFRVKKRQYE